MGGSGRLRVLVVEDDAATAESTAKLLELAGHRVFTAPSARRASASPTGCGRRKWICT